MSSFYQANMAIEPELTVRQATTKRLPLPIATILHVILYESHE